jgi:hypothetical protein
MRLGSFRLHLIALVATAALAGCTSPPPPPAFPDIHFTAETPIRLSVSSVQVQSDFRPTYQPPHVEDRFPVTPEHAMVNWAHDRLMAAGGSNAYARFVIEDASVVEVKLKKKNQGITGAFTTEPAERYDGTLAARLEILDEHGVPVRSAEVKVTRSQSVLEGITPNQRDQTWYDMTKAMMADFDHQMSAEISNHFGGYF